jgi:hypothetical protein
MELAAEAERVARAKKAAAAFITSVEDQVHLTLGQLEKVRELTITAKAAKAQEPQKAAPQKAQEPPQAPEDIAKEIERELSQALGDTGSEADLGDTMVIGPLGK